MNILAHLAAIIVSLGMAIYSFSTLSVTWLGYGFSFMVLFWFAWGLDAAWFDIQDLQRVRDDRRAKKFQRQNPSYQEDGES